MCISSLRRETISAVRLVCIIILLPVAVNESRRTNRKSQNVDTSDGNARTASTAGPDLMKLAAVTACYQSRGGFFKVNFCQFVCSIVLQCSKSFKK